MKSPRRTTMSNNDDSYVEFKLDSGRVLVRRESIPRLKSVDMFAFDCDGTLIDTEESFVLATFRTSEKMLEVLHGREIDTGRQGRQMLSALRQTGLYNNDWDSAFAIVCFVSMAAAEYDGRSRTAPAAEIMDRANALVREFTASEGRKGIESVKELMMRHYSSLSRQDDYNRIMHYMNYPNMPDRSPLSALYLRLYLGDSGTAGGGDGSALKWPDGLIGNEHPLVEARTMQSIVSLSGGRKAVILTGNKRSFVAAALGGLTNYFDMDSSLFITDMEESRAEELELFRKPSEAGLLRAVERTNSACVLYAGDSGEDMLMVFAARKKGVHALFTGVTGNTPDPESFRAFFMEKGADAVIESVNQLPETLIRLRSLN